jgi:predicted Zn-dependent protease
VRRVALPNGAILKEILMTKQSKLQILLVMLSLGIIAVAGNYQVAEAQPGRRTVKKTKKPKSPRKQSTPRPPEEVTSMKIITPDDEALNQYSKEIEANPKDATAYYNRGLFYQKQGDYKAAIADYTKVIKLNPQDARSYNNRGFAYFSYGNYKAAIADLNKVIELNPQNTDAYTRRGFFYEMMGKKEKSAADYKKAKKLEAQP